MNIEIPIWPLKQAYNSFIYRHIHKMRKLGKNVIFGYRISINSPNCISIGDNTKILNDVQLHAQGNKEGSKITIGANTEINSRCFITSAKSIIIGNDVLIAANVFISDHIHNYEDVFIPIREQGLSKIKPVNVGDGSWLGINSVIMPGVTIGNHCVVGSNSVVTKSVPDYSVVAGIPGKIIKQYDFKKKQWVRFKNGEI